MYVPLERILSAETAWPAPGWVNNGRTSTGADAVLTAADRDKVTTLWLIASVKRPPLTKQKKKSVALLLPAFEIRYFRRVKLESRLTIKKKKKKSDFVTRSIRCRLLRFGVETIAVCGKWQFKTAFDSSRGPSHLSRPTVFVKRFLRISASNSSRRSFFVSVTPITWKPDERPCRQKP